MKATQLHAAPPPSLLVAAGFRLERIKHQRIGLVCDRVDDARGHQVRRRQTRFFVDLASPRIPRTRAVNKPGRAQTALSNETWLAASGMKLNPLPFLRAAPHGISIGH
jgi:hypothetical protein